MAKLQILSFEDDDIIAQRIKEKSNEFKEFGKEFVEYVVNLVLDVLTEIDEINGGKNRLVQRRDEIMQNLRDCGFEKKILLERYSKLSRDRKHRALVYNCFGQKVGDALKVEIVSTATGEVVASKWDEDLPRCAAGRKSIERNNVN